MDQKKAHKADLKNICYSSHESSKTGKCNTFLVSFNIPLGELYNDSRLPSLHMQDILEITHQTTLKEVRPNTAPFSSDVGLTKFVLASELFVPRPYFMSFDSQKIHEKPHGWLFNLFFEEGSQNWN